MKAVETPKQQVQIETKAPAVEAKKVEVKPVARIEQTPARE